MDGTGGLTQLAEGLPSKCEPLGSITHKPGVEAHICNLSAQEMEAGGSSSQCHSQLYSNANGSLEGYITRLPCFLFVERGVSSQTQLQRLSGLLAYHHAPCHDELGLYCSGTGAPN